MYTGFNVKYDNTHKFQIERNFINSGSNDDFDKQSIAEFNVLEFSHPGVAHTEIKYNWQTVEMKIPGVKPTFEGFEVTFLLDSELKVYKYFNNWLKYYGDQKKIEQVAEVQTKQFNQFIYSTGKMFLMDNDLIKPSFYFEYQNMFPVGISNLSFGSNKTNITPLLLKVRFSIDSFKLIDL